MQTRLAEFVRETPDGDTAREIVGRCVHCGFCTATCPTYQLLGDELDGPRGRIYLIKQVLEGATPTAKTQLHLDRCLTCRACETTCPSGVEYGRLLDVGRRLVDAAVPRSPGSRMLRGVLKRGLTSAAFGPALRLGRAARPLLPPAIRKHIPAAQTPGAWPRRPHERRMLLLAGCVQPAMAPNIDAATARVLDALGIETLVAREAGCCGAIRHHLDDQEAALDDARRNIDAWWPHVESGVAAIVMNASGCGVMVRDYGHLLQHDSRYATRAAAISARTRDIAEVVTDHGDSLAMQRAAGSPVRIAFHPPCTLQHGQRIRGVVEALLRALGADVVAIRDSHLCCGSAGTYSILQPELSGRLRERKLAALDEARPDVILSANIGCIAHLAADAQVPVRHWIEWVDERLAQT